MTIIDFIEHIWWPRKFPHLQQEWAATVAGFHLSYIKQSLLGRVPLTLLDVQGCQDFWSDLRLQKSGPMANKILATLKCVIRDAKDWGYIESLPTWGLKPRRAKPGRKRFLQSGEASLLLKLASYRLRPYLLMALHTGARSRSIRELQWRDIDLDGGTVTFRVTKSGVPYSIPLHPELQRLLRGYRGRKKEMERVLPWYEAKSLSRAFARLVIRCGLKDLRFHDLRHDVASRLVQQGVSLLAVQSILGHQNIQSTARYSHLTARMLQCDIAKL